MKMVAKCFQADGLQSYLFSCCLHPQKRYHLALFKILNGFYHEQAMIQQMDPKIVEQKTFPNIHNRYVLLQTHYKTYIFAFFADNVTILQNTVVNFRNN